MTPELYDTVVIGGGPGGSSAATLLARAHRRVLLLEREHFPRFHVGESLLPYNHAIFEELGLLPKLAAAGFPTKYGAQFLLGNGTKGTYFVFGHGQFTRHPTAFQVERAKFDDLLLRHAADSGVEVREGCTVTQTQTGPEGVSVTARDETGANHTFRARFLIDASGRGNFTGNQAGLRITDPKLRKLAIFGHFEKVELVPGNAAGDTVIVRLDNKWFWLIPLDLGGPGRPNRVSVGLVLDRDDFTAAERPPEELFRELVAAHPTLAQRLRHATPVSPLHVTSDFSYCNRSFWSPRVLRVGDAAGFIDPIFSSGVFLAMFSAQLAAKAVLTALAAGSNGEREFPPYERRVRAAMQLYRDMVERFYTTPFVELFLEPRSRFGLVAAINAVLAGELDGGWRIKWRLKLFYLLVRLQAKYPLVPRIAFAPTSTA
jgi:FADH2-dependent halogenase